MVPKTPTPWTAGPAADGVNRENAGPGAVATTLPASPAATSAASRAPAGTPRWAVTATAGVGVLLVLGVLLLSGVLFPPAPAGAAESSFATALPIAQARATAALGPGASLYDAEAVETAEPLSLPTNETGADISNASLPTGCHAAAGDPIPATFDLPGGDVSTGRSVAWTFGFWVSATGTIALVWVLDGAAYLGATVSGPSCLSESGPPGAVPADALDSPQAAADASAAGGASFVAVHPEADVAFALIGGVPALGGGPGPAWLFDYTTCPIGAANASIGAQFTAAVNATTGAVLSAQWENATVCSAGSGTTSVGSAVALDPPAESSVGGEHWYNFTVASSGGGIELQSLAFGFEAASGAPFSPADLSAVAVLSVTGATVATYDVGSEAWTDGGSLVLSAGETISVGPTASDLSGTTFVVLGEGAWSGSILTTIP